jgi:hypothetical protein
VLEVNGTAWEGGETVGADVEAEARGVMALPTLDGVRERLSLEDRWGMNLEEVREELRGAVDVEVVPESTLIRIKVQRTDPDEARLLALVMANVYRDLRNAEVEAEARGMLEALDSELEKQEREVEEKRKALERILEEGGLKYREEAAEEIGEKQAIYSSEELNPLELEAEGRRLDRILEELEDREGQELYRYASELVLPQNTASIVFKEYERERRESEDLRASGFGEAHPKVVANEIRLSILKDDLERAIKKMGKRTRELRTHLERRKEVFPRWDGSGREAHLAAWQNSMATQLARDAFDKEEKVLGALRAARSEHRIQSLVETPPLDLAREPKAGEILTRPARFGLAAGAVVGVTLGMSGMWKSSGFRRT